MAGPRSPRSPKNIALTIDVSAADGIQVVSKPTPPTPASTATTPVALLATEPLFTLTEPLLDPKKRQEEIAAAVALADEKRARLEYLVAVTVALADEKRARLEYLATVHTQMEQDDDDALRRFFESRPHAQLKNELNYAIQELKENVDLIGDDTKHPAYAYKDSLANILTGVKASKDKASSKELPTLIEFTHEAARFAKDSNDEKNNRRFAVSTERVSKCSWGRWIGGAVAVLFGGGLIASGIMLACSSGGLATPLSAGAMWLGKTAVAWGAVAVVGGTTSTLCGGYLMGTACKHADATNPARALFAPPPPPPPIDGTKMADVLASQYTPGGTRRI
jgi:hypothetical protein